MITIALLVIFGGIAAAAIFSTYADRDNVKVTIDARLFSKIGDAGTLQIELRNFGPRSAHIDRVVIDGDVTIISAREGWSIDRNTVRPEPLNLRRYDVAFLVLELRRFYNANAVWAHGTIVETGAPWSAKAKIIRG